MEHLPQFLSVIELLATVPQHVDAVADLVFV